MTTSEARQELEKQQYRLVGRHSAVKICHWTKNRIRGRGGCYKWKFYGINSHQCLQMTTSLSCANRCTFCWRSYKAPVSKEWEGEVDAPEEILKGSLQAHAQLLIGFGGLEKADKKAYDESKKIRHVALSLTGEPIIYPKINELIDLFHRNRISTFLVTNAQYPQQIRNLKPVTQLYLSLDAPTPELLKEVDRPLFSDYWERLNQSLEYLAKKKPRTCLRLTLIKNVNLLLPEKYAKLILKGNPDFVEVKGYMHLGESRKRLKRENMPLHEEIVAFAQELVEYLPRYEIVSEQIPSRVVLLAKKEFKKRDGWHTWIDFSQFFRSVSSGREFTSSDYCQKMPPEWLGISERGTRENLSKDKGKGSVENEG